MPDKNGKGREPRIRGEKKPGGNESLSGKHHRERGKHRFTASSHTRNVARGHAHSPPSQQPNPQG